jgi:multidrug transporter EmrE-like cation transporter
MKTLNIGYVYILLTVFFTTYGQIVLKWQMPDSEALPLGFSDKFLFLIKLIFTPWIFSTFVAAFLASLTWMAALTKFEISYAYPFMSASLILVFILGVILLNENYSNMKMIGSLLIIFGITVLSNG